uniref:Uncharacterized protein n=1 Tax=Arion vulgaris TaxID=1028688 RepID=A0A0B7AWJ7_9EUPU
MLVLDIVNICCFSKFSQTELSIKVNTIVTSEVREGTPVWWGTLIIEKAGLHTRISQKHQTRHLDYS